MRLKLRASTLLAIWLTASHSVSAQSAEAEVARQSFQAGVVHAQAGEYEAAIREFERAHAAMPHYAVLYNLGQAHALSGRPVEAVDLLSRYLEQGGAAIGSQRRAEVEATIARNQRRVSTLELRVKPAHARVEIDGRGLDDRWKEGRIAVATGRHAIVATAPGFATQAQSVDVVLGKNTLVSMALQPARDAAEASSAWLEISCSVPGVAIHVDNEALGRTPILTPLRIQAGKHRVRFSRAGYHGAELSLIAVAGKMARVDCALRVHRDLGSNERGALHVVVNEPHARVLVDGAPFAGGPLPVGPHFVEVHKAAFRPWKGEITVRPQFGATLNVALRADQEYAAEHRHRVHTRRAWAYVMAGSGVSLGVAASALGLASASRYEEWQQGRSDLARARALSPMADHTEKIRQVERSGLAVQQFDDWALASAIAGGSLLAAGVTLFLTSGDPDRYAGFAPGVSHRDATLSWRIIW